MIEMALFFINEYIFEHSESNMVVGCDLAKDLSYLGKDHSWLLRLDCYFIDIQNSDKFYGKHALKKIVYANRTDKFGHPKRIQVKLY